MAFLLAHIIFQIRHGFRSRIFFELKIPFAPTQSLWGKVNFLLIVYNAWHGKQLISQATPFKLVASIQLVAPHHINLTSPNQNYI